MSFQFSNHEALLDGNIVKLIPLIINGKMVKSIKNTTVITNGMMLHDQTNFLDDLFFYLRKKEISHQNFIVQRHIFCLYMNNEIKYVNVSRSLYKILHNYEFSFNDCKHLEITISKSSVGSYYFDDYSKSKIIEKNWDIPYSDREEDYKEWFNKNSSQLNEYLLRSNIFNNMDLLHNKYGNIVSEFISELRNEKINKLGINV